MFRIVAGIIAILISMTACSNEMPTTPTNTEIRDSIGVANDKSWDASIDEQRISMLDVDGLEYERLDDDIRTEMTFKAARSFDRQCRQFLQNSSGTIPHSWASEDDSGKRFLEYLPNGQFFRNEFSGRRTEPELESAAGGPGAIGYYTLARGGVFVGYVITAYGATYLEYLTIEFDPQNDDSLK